MKNENSVAKLYFLKLENSSQKLHISRLYIPIKLTLLDICFWSSSTAFTMCDVWAIVNNPSGDLQYHSLYPNVNSDWYK